MHYAVQDVQRISLRYTPLRCRTSLRQLLLMYCLPQGTIDINALYSLKFSMLAKKNNRK